MVDNLKILVIFFNDNEGMKHFGEKYADVSSGIFITLP